MVQICGGWWATVPRVDKNEHWSHLPKQRRLHNKLQFGEWGWKNDRSTMDQKFMYNEQFSRNAPCFDTWCPQSLASMNVQWTCMQGKNPCSQLNGGGVFIFRPRNGFFQLQVLLQLQKCGFSISSLKNTVSVPFGVLKKTRTKFRSASFCSGAAPNFSVWELCTAPCGWVGCWKVNWPLVNTGRIPPHPPMNFDGNKSRIPTHPVRPHVGPKTHWDNNITFSEDCRLPSVWRLGKNSHKIQKLWTLFLLSQTASSWCTSQLCYVTLDDHWVHAVLLRLWCKIAR